MNMKKAVKTLAVTAALAAGLCISAAAVGVTVEGKAVEFTDAVPFVDENNRTQVPLRAVADAMGLEVEWDNDARVATFSKTWTLETSPRTWDVDGDGVKESYQSYVSVDFYPGRTTYDIWVESMELNLESGKLEDQGGGPSPDMDTAPVLKDGRMYAPIRYLAEEFFMDVQWDGASQTVVLTKSMPSQWHWYYSVDPDSKENNVQLLLAGVENMKSARFTALRIARLPDNPGEGFDGQPVTFAPTAGDAIIARAAENGHGPLALLTASYTFDEKGTYEVMADFTYETENGIQKESTLNLEVEVK